jgi:hypothetical protein
MFILKIDDKTVGHCEEIIYKEFRRKQFLYSVGSGNIPIDTIYGAVEGYDIYVQKLYIEPEFIRSEFTIEKYEKIDYRTFVDIFYFCKINLWNKVVDRMNYTILDNVKIFSEAHLRKEYFTPDELVIKDIIE